MKTITIQDLKRHGARAFSGDGPVYLIVNSKPHAVLLSVAEYEAVMDALEELEDAKAVAARAHERELSADEVFDDPSA